MVAHPKFHHESKYLLGEVQVTQHVVFVGETFLLKIGQSPCAALHTPCTAAQQYPCLVMEAHPKFHHESNYLLGEVQVPQHVVFVG